jgi:uncharacterized cupin superfamily protein
MSKIKVEHEPSEARLEELGVKSWPIWSKEASEFPWSYDESETCYFLEGEVLVTCEDGETAEVGRGDLVTFPQGMNCTWKISKDVRKHYRFGSGQVSRSRAEPGNYFHCQVQLGN